MTKFEVMERTAAMVNIVMDPINGDMQARHLMLDYKISGVDYHRAVVALIPKNASDTQIVSAGKKLAAQFNGELTFVTVYDPVRGPRIIKRTRNPAMTHRPRRSRARR